MTNAIDMQAKMAAIGARYLTRTMSELDDLAAMIRSLSSGHADGLKEIEVLAHRIRGSGAVFGFGQLSEAAGVIEMAAVRYGQQDRIDVPQVQSELQAQLATLRDATERSVQAAAAV